MRIAMRIIVRVQAYSKRGHISRPSQIPSIEGTGRFWEVWFRSQALPMQGISYFDLVDWTGQVNQIRQLASRTKAMD